MADDDRELVLDALDPASIADIGRALAALGPSLDRAVATGRDAPFPAYTGTNEPLPDEGAGLDVVLEELAAHVAEGCRISMPGFVGFITTGATTSAIAAQAAAAAAGGQRYLHHSFNHLERIGLAWLADVCGIPGSATGVFTSGGSTANLLALGAARQAAFERIGVDVATAGVPATPTRIYASARAHRTVHRAAGVLGFGREAVREIETDRAGHIDVDALVAALDEDESLGIMPMAIVALAGATDTGAVDDLARIGEIARERGIWLHVDGAYGLIAHACDELIPRFRGVDRADSWIVDPHKWLATGVGVGAVYVRDGDVLTRAFAEGEAAYLEGSFGEPAEVPESQFDGIAGLWADQSLELSAPPRGVLVWSVLREIGRRGVGQRVRQHVAFAAYLADLIRSHPRLELLCEPGLSIVCFRYVPDGDHGDLDALNAGILQRLRLTPTVPSSTIVDGSFAIRPCFINPRTTRADVDDLLRRTIAIGDELTS